MPPARHGRSRVARLAFVLVLTIGPGAFLGRTAWHACGKYGERCAEANRFYPIYDEDTRRIVIVMHDLSGNGIIDTWVHRSGSGIQRIEIDQDEDGSIDRRLIPGEDGANWRVEAGASGASMQP